MVFNALCGDAGDGCVWCLGGDTQVQVEVAKGERATMPLSRPMVKTGGRWAFMALSGGRWGASQRFVLAVLCSLVVVGGGAVLHLGAEAVGHWWDTTTLVQRTAPLYMISLLPYLDFLNKLQVGSCSLFVVVPGLRSKISDTR